MITHCPLCQQEVIESNPPFAGFEEFYKRCKTCLRLGVSDYPAFECKYYNGLDSTGSVPILGQVDLTIRDRRLITYYDHPFSSTSYTTIDHIWEKVSYTTMQQLVTTISDKHIIKIPALPLKLFLSPINQEEFYNKIKMWITFS